MVDQNTVLCEVFVDFPVFRDEGASLGQTFTGFDRDRLRGIFTVALKLGGRGQVN
jgi:hypothetical protein